MGYFIGDANISLGDLQRRIEETDLIPSRASLLDGIEDKFKAFSRQSIETFAGLRNELKNAAKLEALSGETGIDIEYLTLLRREIESYFPKPSKLKEFDWIPEEEIAKLEQKGIRNTAYLYEATSDEKDRDELLEDSGVNAEVFESLVHLADLTRVQWVSPLAARMLMDAGCGSASSLAKADAEELCAGLEKINEGGKYFKGKIGLRDVKRLVKSAGYVSPDIP